MSRLALLTGCGFEPPSTGESRPCVGAFTDQVALYLCQGSEDRDTGAQPADTFTLQTAEADYVAVFNFSGQAKAVKTLDLPRLGLSSSACYTFRDLWTQQTTSATGKISLPLEPAASTIFRVSKE